jgi:hypothetical protein
VILALVALLGLTAPLPAGGTYHYAQIANGKTISTEAVTVRWNGTTVAVTENRKPESEDGVYATSESVYDAVTLSLISYREIATQGCGELQYSVDVRGSQVKTSDKKLDFAGESRFILSNEIAMPFFLAAQTSLWSSADPIAIDPARNTGHVAVAPVRLKYDRTSFVIDDVATPSMEWKRI